MLTTVMRRPSLDRLDLVFCQSHLRITKCYERELREFNGLFFFFFFFFSTWVGVLFCFAVFLIDRKSMR
jgi:hypothetical protein